MSLKDKNYLRTSIASGVISGLILFGCVAVARVQGADSNSQPRFPAPAAALPQVSFYQVGAHRLWGLSYRILHPIIPRLVAGEWDV